MRKLRDKVIQLAQRVKKWFFRDPLLSASEAFIVGEGFFESVLITTSAIALFASGQVILGFLFSIWAGWEIVARYVVVRHLQRRAAI